MEYVNFIKENEIIVFVKVSFEDTHTYRICISPQSNSNIKLDELELYQQKLERDLIDFNLRDIVTKETMNIRDLLIAKAFSNGEFDESPRSDVSDPVGFNVNEIKNEGD